MKGKPTYTPSLLTMSVAVAYNCFFQRKLFFTAKNCPKYPIPWIVFGQLQVHVGKPRFKLDQLGKKKFCRTISKQYSSSKDPLKLYWYFTASSFSVLSLEM